MKWNGGHFTDIVLNRSIPSQNVEMKTYYIIILASTERDKKGLDVNWMFGIYESEQEAKKNWKSKKPNFEFLPMTVKIQTDETFSSDEKFFEEFMKKYLPEQYEKEKIAKMTSYQQGIYFIKKSL